VGTASDGGGFQGINPSELQQLMKSMTGGVSGAQPVAGSYIGQFSRLGLDTSPITKLLADYSWATTQQPMLQRRYSLASHQPSGDFTDGWTSEGAGTLLYTTTGAAKAAGTSDAKNMQAALDARNWKAIQAQLNAMSQNGGDADYMAAFFSQLGPSGLYALSMYARGAGGKGNDQMVQEIVGSGLASASFEMPLSMKYLQGIEPKDPPLGYVTAEMPGGFDTGSLAPFLTEGQFSDQWLQTISPAVLYQAGSIESPGGEGPPPGYDAIFTAISNSPGFAAKFYQQNASQLNNYMTDPVLYHYLANGQGFGKFLESATIPPAGETNTRPFTANATALVQLFGDADSPIDTSSAVRQAMAAMATNYWGDLTGTVTAAAPGAGSTMGLSAKEWGMFVQTSMKDQTAAAFLLTYYASWNADQKPDFLNTGGDAGDNANTPLNAGYWHNASLGALDYFFASNYAAATAGQPEEANKVTEIAVGAFSAGASALLTSALFGPEAGVMELLGEAGKDAFSSASEESLKTVLGLLADGGDDASDGSDAKKLDSGLTAAADRWSDAANNMWTQSGSAPGNPKFLVEAGYKQGYVEYNGVKWTGDPAPYEQQYGGSFLNADGSMKTTDEIQQDPKALAAYNAWLQDPAVSATLGPEFLSRSSGSLNSLYGNLVGGDGG
jgi:hypothetical protein